MADILCPLCAPRRARRVWSVRGSRTGRRTPLYHCTSCDSFFQRPGYSEDDDALRRDLEWHIGHSAECIREAQDLLRELRGLHPQGSSLLDVGCGIGSLMSVAVEEGLSCQGIEPNPHAVRYARGNGLIQVIEGRFSAEHFESMFDFVVIDSVLEHVPEPKTMIRDALSVLRPAGILYISVPNRIGGAARIAYSAALPSSRFSLFTDNDVHINHFSRRGLVDCVGELGGELVRERAPWQFVLRRPNAS